jgi:hypothetical protein
MEVRINAQPIEGPEKEKKYGKFDEWEIKCAVDDLIKAEEIKNDKEKMKYVYPLLQEKLGKTKAAIDSLEKLKSVAKEKQKEE